jgi:signal transduction histidine kinase
MSLDPTLWNPTSGWKKHSAVIVTDDSFIDSLAFFWGEEMRTVGKIHIGRHLAILAEGRICLLILGDADAIFTDADIDIFEAFTQAASSGYARYFDLLEIEQHNRELTIESAVNRVRAEAMDMKSADDITNVVKVLWEVLEPQVLGHCLLGFTVVDKKKDVYQHYMATNDTARKAVIPTDKLVQADLIEGVNFYKSELRLSQVLERRGDDVMTFLEGSGRKVFPVRISTASMLTQVWGIDPTSVPKAFDGDVEMQALNVPFAYGGIDIVGPTESNRIWTQDDLALAESFADAITLGFTRYFDFQKLEDQNDALSDANKKLFQVNVDLEHANAEIQQQSERKSSFLASMSHELRTPMNAIKGFTSLVLRRSGDLLPERQKENLVKVIQASDHLLGMINDLLDLSKIEAGRMDVNPTQFRIEDLIVACVSTVSPLVKEGVRLIYECDDIGDAHTDEARVRQMVINLLSNAIKFTDIGEVKVTATSQEPVIPKSGGGLGTWDLRPATEMLEISVSDTGKGIPEGELGTVFDEYRQVKGSESSVQKGTGLGLSITKRFAELLGGSIGVVSEVGKGSMFTVRIPVVYKT